MPKSTDELNRSNQQEVYQDEGYFLIIPPIVLADEDIPTGAKMVYGRVFGLTKKYGYCNASSDYIGKHIGFTQRTVQTYLCTLYKKGYLFYEEARLDNGAIERRIYLNLAPRPAPQARAGERVRSKSQGGYDHNRKGVRSKSYRSNKSKEEREEGKILSKGQSPSFSPQKGKRNDLAACSHLEQGTIRNGTVNTRGESTPSKKPTTQHNETQSPGRQSIGQLIGVPREHLQKLHQQNANPNPHQPKHLPNVTNHPSRKPQGRSKSAPIFIQAIIGDWFSPEMHDQAISSTITSVADTYTSWRNIYQIEDPEQAEDEFRQLMFSARDTTKRATIQARTPDGRPNRVPYFKKTLEKMCGLGTGLTRF